MYKVLKDVLMVTVTNNGGIVINDAVIEDGDALKACLSAAAQRQPQPTIFIRMESEEANYEPVGKVIYSAKRVGLESPVHFVNAEGKVVT